VTKIETWPPPEDWTEIVISWQTMLENADHAPNDIIKWLDKTPGVCYHLHGWKSTEGFAFRFENPHDAMLFALRWSKHERA
jgi:hypothetical protein